MNAGLGIEDHDVCSIACYGNMAPAEYLVRMESLYILTDDSGWTLVLPQHYPDQSIYFHKESLDTI